MQSPRSSKINCEFKSELNISVQLSRFQSLPRAPEKLGPGYCPNYGLSFSEDFSFKHQKRATWWSWSRCPNPKFLDFAIVVLVRRTADFSKVACYLSDAWNDNLNMCVWEATKFPHLVIGLNDGMSGQKFWVDHSLDLNFSSKSNDCTGTRLFGVFAEMCWHLEDFHITHEHTRRSQDNLTYITLKRCKIIITSLQSVITVFLKKKKKKEEKQQAYAFPSLKCP